MGAKSGGGQATLFPTALCPVWRGVSMRQLYSYIPVNVGQVAIDIHALWRVSIACNQTVQSGWFQIVRQVSHGLTTFCPHHHLFSCCCFSQLARHCSVRNASQGYIGICWQCRLVLLAYYPQGISGFCGRRGFLHTPLKILHVASHHKWAPLVLTNTNTASALASPLQICFLWPS